MQSFAVNLTGNPGFGQLLGQARGEKVEVTLQQGNAAQPGTVTGSVIGVEKQKQHAGKDGTVEVEMLNLWCAEGMRSVKLADVQRVRFLNPVLEGEFKRALETLALSHDTQKKAVSLTFNGEGKREVRVSYVVENPIWKTSYRLVLSTKKDGKPMLQGWAIVDNSQRGGLEGRAHGAGHRPAHLLPDGPLPAAVRPPPRRRARVVRLPPAAHLPRRDGETDCARRRRQEAGPVQRIGGGLQMPAPAKAPPRGAARDRDAPMASRSGSRAGHGPEQGRGVVGDGGRAGRLLPVRDRPPGHAAAAEKRHAAHRPEGRRGRRVSIYNEATQAKHPLLGLKFKNTTGMHLMQGPITVFEGSSYAGDARVLDIQPKDERLISYAIDLGTEVEPVAKRSRIASPW